MTFLISLIHTPTRNRIRVEKRLTRLVAAIRR